MGPDLPLRKTTGQLLTFSELEGVSHQASIFPEVLACRSRAGVCLGVHGFPSAHGYISGGP